jgi:hypothetical protein
MRLTDLRKELRHDGIWRYSASQGMGVLSVIAMFLIS